MDPKWLKVAGELLERASNEFVNHGCNDWKWPEGWTEADKLEFATCIVEDNVGRPRDKFNPLDIEDRDTLARGGLGPSDWWVMLFLGRKLQAVT